MRIELTTTAWEAVVLPLNYTRTSEQTPLTVICANHKLQRRYVVPPLSQKILLFNLFWEPCFFLFNKLCLQRFMLSHKLQQSTYLIILA